MRLTLGPIPRSTSRSKSKSRSRTVVGPGGPAALLVTPAQQRARPRAHGEPMATRIGPAARAGGHQGTLPHSRQGFSSRVPPHPLPYHPPGPPEGPLRGPQPPWPGQDCGSDERASGTDRNPGQHGLRLRRKRARCHCPGQAQGAMPSQAAKVRSSSLGRGSASAITWTVSLTIG